MRKVRAAGQASPELPHRTERFGLLPRYVMSRPELSPFAKVVYACLSAHAGDRPTTTPLSIATIAAETGRSKKTAERALAELQRQKLVRATLRREKGRPSSYTMLTHHWLAEWRKAEADRAQAKALAEPHVRSDVGIVSDLTSGPRQDCLIPTPDLTGPPVGSDVGPTSDPTWEKRTSGRSSERPFVRSGREGAAPPQTAGGAGPLPLRDQLAWLEEQKAEEDRAKTGTGPT